MNKEVSVVNMAVQAKAEGGLLISETSGYTASDVWDDQANTTAEIAAAKVALYPTSTANGVAWYHATSKSATDAAAATAANTPSGNKADGYTSLTLTANTLQAAAAGTNGLKEVYFDDTNLATSGYDADDAKYYLKYTYYLKTSTEGTTSLGLAAGNQNVQISRVNVTNPDTVVSGDLDKSLRVGIAMGGKFYIFAPISGATGSYFVAAGATATTAINSSSSATTPMTVSTALGSLPGNKATGTAVNIYMWYEGEDAACKSDNITATLDELTVDVTFSLVTLAADATDVGVSMS
jgi:hypothetical protein